MNQRLFLVDDYEQKKLSRPRGAHNSNQSVTPQESHRRLENRLGSSLLETGGSPRKDHSIVVRGTATVHALASFRLPVPRCSSHHGLNSGDTG